MGLKQSKNPYKEAASLLTHEEVTILRKLFNDLASRSEDDVIDKQTFLKLIPLPGILGERLFSVVDQDGSGVDLEEFLCCIAVLTKGSQEMKGSLLFQIFNLENHKLGICVREFVTMMNSIFCETSDDDNSIDHDLSDEFEEVDDSELPQKMKQLDMEIDEEIHSVQHKRLQDLLRFKHHLETHIATLGQSALEEYRRTGETVPKLLENFAKDIVSECDEDKSGRLSFEQFKKGLQKYPVIMDSIFLHPAVLALQKRILKMPCISNGRTFVTQTPSEPQEPNSSVLIHGYLHRPGSLFKGLVKKYYVVSEGFLHEYKSEQAFFDSKPYNIYFLSGASINIPDSSNLFTLITKRIEQIDKTLRDQDGISAYEAFELMEERKNLVTQEKTIHEEEHHNSPPEMSDSEELMDLGERKPKHIRRLTKGHLSKTPSSSSSKDDNINHNSLTPPRLHIGSPTTSPSLKPTDPNHLMDMPKLELPPMSPKLPFFRTNTNFDEHEQEKFEFQVIFPHKSISFFLDSDEKRSRWVEAIEKAAKIRKVEDYYHILYEEKLGVGCFANVYGCEEIETGEKYAVKVVDKVELTDTEKETLATEISCMNLLHHPNIVSKKDVFETPDTVYIVMEHLTGGTILEKIEKNGRFTPERARSITEQILEGVRYIHNAGVLHRDLKPSNIIFVNNSDDSAIKILDFGLSTFSRPNQTFNKPVGTLKYFAPELIKEQEYNSSVDMWCIGVILYNMLVGRFPFVAETEEQLLDSIEQARYECVSDEWKSVPEPAKDLIRRLLKINPKLRLTAEKALEHAWIKQK